MMRKKQGGSCSGFDAPAKEDGPSGDFWQSRRRKLSEGIYQCLNEAPELNLDGFMTFRLQSYEQELREMAEYAVDEFMLDQQYEEFVSLLKYFVYFQEPKMPLVHVIHKGKRTFAAGRQSSPDRTPS